MLGYMMAQRDDIIPDSGHGESEEVEREFGEAQCEKRPRRNGRGHERSVGRPRLPMIVAHQTAWTSILLHYMVLVGSMI